MSTLKSLLDAYGALFFAQRRTVGALVLAATLLDPAAGSCGLAAGLAALAARALLRLPPLSGEADVLNAIYAGLALGAFHAYSPWLAALAACGGMLIVPLGAALSQVLQGARGLPLLGAPFLCTSWILLAAAKSLGLPLRWSWPPAPEWLPNLLSQGLAQAGALFYVANPLSGLLVLAALLIASRALALLACGGGMLGYTLVIMCGIPATSPLPMLAAFNGALTAMFLGGALAAPGRRSLLVATGGAVTATLLSAALLVLLWPLGLPPLSAPFLLAVWLARAALRPETSAWWIRYWLPSPSCPEASMTSNRLARARGVEASSVMLYPPFAGRMEVSQPVNGAYTHQGPWRYALDFVHTEHGRSFRNDGATLEDFYCYDMPVISPAWGCVIACRNDVADNAPGDTNFADNWGNYVMIALGNGYCVLLAHLRPGSVAAVPGQAVAPGTMLGRCGNSGRSGQPHLHLHVQHGSWLGAPTQPFHLTAYLDDECYVLDGMPQTGGSVELPATENSLHPGFSTSAGREWTYAAGTVQWKLSAQAGLYGETSLLSTHGASIRVGGGTRLLALYQRNGPADTLLDAYALAFGLTPYTGQALNWRDAPDARLLPLSPWQRLRVTLRHPFGANLDSRYTRRWDAARMLWVQCGEHRSAAAGGYIAAMTEAWISETAGPVAFMLSIDGRPVAKAALAGLGNQGDYGVPDWFVPFAAPSMP